MAATGRIDAILWKGGKVARAVDLGGAARLRLLGGLRHQQRPRRVRPALRQEGAHVSVPLEARPHDRAERAEWAHTAGGRPGQERDQRTRRDRRQRCSSPASGARCAGRARARRASSPRCRDTPGRMHGASASDGVVSGWSRKLPSDDGENNPVIWTKSGKVIALKTAPGRADGAAEATNRSGLTVGYLGNLGTDTDPESDQAAVWRTRTAEPQLIGPARPLRLRGARRRQRPRTGRRHVGHVHEERLPGRQARDLAARLDRPAPPSRPRRGPQPTASSARSSTTSTPTERSSATSTASRARTSASFGASTPSSGRARSGGDGGWTSEV